MLSSRTLFKPDSWQPHIFSLVFRQCVARTKSPYLFFSAYLMQADPHLQSSGSDGICREIHSKAWVPLPLCPDFPLALDILDFTSPGVYLLPNLPLLQVSSCSLICATAELVPWAIQSVFLPPGYSPCWWWSMLAAQGFDFLQVHSDLRELEK